MKVSIIVPNWNGKNLLAKNLPFVIKAAQNFDRSTETIVVDDASTDESVLFLKENFPQVKLIQKEKNEGFSSSVNLGVENANADFVILLNTDVKPEENFISPLIQHFNDPKVFAVGCLDKSYEEGKTVERGRGLAKFEKGAIIHRAGETKKGITFWASGGSSAFDRRKWLSLGGLDRIFDPFYGEDLDLGFRAWKAGFTILFEPESIVHHFHEEGTILRNVSDLKKKSVTFRNQLFFVWKNITDKKMLLAHCLWLPYHILKTILVLDLSFFLGLVNAIPLVKKVRKQRRLVTKTFKRQDKEIFDLFKDEK